MGIDAERRETAGPVPADEPAEGPRYRWYHKAGALLLIFFCFELGSFLLLAPWLEIWHRNYFSFLLPEVWKNAYVRGAVSGLGLIDIGISFSELFRLRRFSKR